MSAIRKTRRSGRGGGEGEGEGKRERRRTDKRTSLRRRRNIKLNKRSIFCSLFLTGVELRHFATLFSPRPPSLGLVGLPFPPLYYSLPLPLPRALPPSFFPSVGSLFLIPLSLLRRLLLCFVSSRLPLFLSLSLSAAACASKRAAQRRGTLSK